MAELYKVHSAPVERTKLVITSHTHVHRPSFRARRTYSSQQVMSLESHQYCCTTMVQARALSQMFSRNSHHRSFQLPTHPTLELPYVLCHPLQPPCLCVAPGNNPPPMTLHTTSLLKNHDPPSAWIGEVHAKLVA